MVSGSVFEVLIAGGGVAALEGALALRDLAGERVSLKLVAPNSEFLYRPLTVREPFSYGRAQRYSLREIAGDVGAELLEDSLAHVDPPARVAHTESGAELPYDGLMLCLGAQVRARYEHVITLDDKRLDELLHGLVQDMEEGYVKRLAFLIPGRMAWPLPIYELALMTARRAFDMNIEPAITILSPENAPLSVFGKGASRGVAELLAEHHIEMICSVHCEVPRSGLVEIRPGGRRLEVDRVVALPELLGPLVTGLPGAPGGFIPVDRHCQVRGVERVYAAGDATNFRVKHGGIAAQQADTAAQAIAALAGAPVQPRPFHPVIQGVLLTGGEPRYLSARITGGHGFNSRITEQPTWSPSNKIAARYLAPYLQERDRAADRLRRRA